MTKKQKYELMVPPQMELFRISDDLRDYSHMVELYDLIPKYHHGSANRIEGKYLDSIEREFEFAVRKTTGEKIKKKYKVRIAPANIRNKNSEKYFYPSQREELVEDALRKIAVEKGGVYVNGQAGVKFTLYELEQELKRRGHGYSRAQIKESIDVCKGTQIELQSLEGNKVVEYKFNIFEDVAFASSNTDMKDDNLSYVSFNKMVTSSINKKEFRLYNYSKGISFKYILSRWLFKRISYNFRQASGENPYTIKVSTIIRDSGMRVYEKISNNIRQVEKAFTELEDNRVIKSYSGETIYDETRKNKIKDIKYVIYLTEEFCKDIKKANYFEEKLTDDRAPIKDQGELLDLKGEVEREMKRKEFSLDKNFIKKHINSLQNAEDINNTSLALKAALEIIAEYKNNNKKHSPTALTKVALKEGWVPQSSTEEDDYDIAKEEGGEAYNADDRQIYEDFISTLRNKINNDAAFNSWLKNISLVSVTPLTLEVKSKFVKQWVEEHYGDILKETTKEVFGKNKYELKIKK